MKDLTDIHKVAMLLYVVFQDKHSNTGNKGLDSEVSNIANVLLEPEFFKFVMTIFKMIVLFLSIQKIVYLYVRLKTVIKLNLY